MQGVKDKESAKMLSLMSTTGHASHPVMVAQTINIRHIASGHRIQLSD